MNNEKPKTENTNTEEVSLYCYFDNKGVKLSTGNLEFARVRALSYGTEVVYVEKK